MYNLTLFLFLWGEDFKSGSLCCLMHRVRWSLDWAAGLPRGCVTLLGTFLFTWHCCLVPPSICYFGANSCNDNEQSLINLQRNLPKNQCVRVCRAARPWLPPLSILFLRVLMNLTASQPLFWSFGYLERGLLKSLIPLFIQSYLMDTAKGSSCWCWKYSSAAIVAFAECVEVKSCLEWVNSLLELYCAVDSKRLLRSTEMKTTLLKVYDEQRSHLFQSWGERYSLWKSNFES